MEQVQDISQFGIALLWLIGGVLFVGVTLFASKMLAPNRPNAEKLTTYECGEDTEGNARIQLNPRFYIPALIFLIFDVEIVFLYPWATVFADAEIIRLAPSWGWFALVEVFLFVGILLLGLAYVWRKGDLDWVKPEPLTPPNISSIPASAYQSVNERYTTPQKQA